MILLVADLGELAGESAVPAEGLVIESNRDAKRGISATLLVKNGSVKKGEWILAGESLVPVRIMENILGKSIDSATFSSLFVWSVLIVSQLLVVRFNRSHQKKKQRKAQNRSTHAYW